MSAKPNAKSWTDVKMVITAISITATLGLWNLFAANNNLKTVDQQPALEPETQPASLGTARRIQTSPAPVFMGKILLGGQAPQLPAITVNSPAQSGKAPRPQRPAARTHSS